MTVKRFVGATARECLRKVKDELGPDAIVVSNKAVDNGVEIVAMSADSLEALSQGSAGPAASPSVPLQVPEDEDYRVTLSKAQRQPPTIRPWSPAGLPTTSPAAASAELAMARPRPLPSRLATEEKILSPQQVSAELRESVPESPPRLSPRPAPEMPQRVLVEPPTPQVAQLMDEMKTIKGLLERQLAGFAWGELAKETPTKALLLSEMLESGFSGQLARRLIQELPNDSGHEEGRKWLRAAVNRRLRTLSADADFIDRGGVYALVGPTGVGKTTTTAKLAARCVVRYGADRLALLTTDGYRIGAHEQLRIYGRILGVPVFVVRDGEDLRRTLSDLRDKHMVLIDTVGMSQRDRMVAEQAAMLTRSGEVNRLLLLNSGSRGDTLDDVVRAYAGEDLAGCIITKVDEAAALAPAIDCVVRNGLTLAYVANGQRVPEDLHLPNRNYLLHRAFRVSAGETAHRLHEDEVGLSLTSRSASIGASLA